mmetsp:Transcript_1758/g.4446  ORF Transcript_1758/g.4446 Transcript_1758/m.4446 type:complete len:362 (+) Transcript_1758:248-1333(+)
MTRVLPWIEQRPLSSTGLMPFLALLSSASAPSGSGWPISDGSCANAQEFPRWQLPEVWNLHMARLTLPFSLVPWHAEPCLQIIVPSPAGSKYSGRLILLCREHITCEPESGPQLKDSSAKDALLKPLLPPLPSASDGQLPQLSPPLQPQLSSTQLAQLLPLLPAAIPSWMKGHSGPLWHLPCAKNLQSVSEALDMRSLHSDPSLHAKLPSPVSCKHARVLFFPCTEHMASSEPNFPRQPFPVLASAAASSPANSMEVTPPSSPTTGAPISSSECAKLQASPRWHWPIAKNLQNARLMPPSAATWHSNPCLQAKLPSPVSSKQEIRLNLPCTAHSVRSSISPAPLPLPTLPMPLEMPFCMAA